MIHAPGLVLSLGNDGSQDGEKVRRGALAILRHIQVSGFVDEPLEVSLPCSTKC